jgi:thiosulfate/3-mercaptopyruvate sulfurtransferase
MGENGYAKPVLVTTDWVSEHIDDGNVVVAEVDENPDLYHDGLVPISGAIRLHWRDDLQDRSSGI